MTFTIHIALVECPRDWHETVKSFRNCWREWSLPHQRVHRTYWRTHLTGKGQKSTKSTAKHSESGTSFKLDTPTFPSCYTSQLYWRLYQKRTYEWSLELRHSQWTTKVMRFPLRFRDLIWSANFEFQLSGGQCKIFGLWAAGRQFNSGRYILMSFRHRQMCRSSCPSFPSLCNEKLLLLAFWGINTAERRRPICMLN